MNRIGGKSNTGEGGEDPARYRNELKGITVTAGTKVSDVIGSKVIEADYVLQAGDSLRSKIKQVASGRFGVTTEYLVSADQIQIKMAQGAKPGEGGQLPGGKVSEYIGMLRYWVPGVGLISPPPHHDIYSIEDLAQLIHDLKNANPRASISVKLVSEVGVGHHRRRRRQVQGRPRGDRRPRRRHRRVALEQHQACRHALGTGPGRDAADPGAQPPAQPHPRAGRRPDEDRPRRRHRRAARRRRVRLRHRAAGGRGLHHDAQVPPQHLPGGRGHAGPGAARKFAGKPEHVVNYFFFVAEEARQIMAQLGIRRFDDLIGRADLLDTRKGIAHWKARGLDFSRIFHQPAVPADVPRHQVEAQDHGLERALDVKLIEKCRPAIERGEKVQFMEEARNVNRSVGAMLSGELIRQRPEGLPDHTIFIQMEGTGGQSFGAFLASGITLYLIGDANDYTGKGLSGGRVVVRPSIEFRGDATQNIIIGNTALYGATSGEAFFRGVAGERFAVRLSGATAVVEGTGDHGCEYMTGGTVVVLGRTGRNFAAGMSGGVAYVYDEDGQFARRCNTSMVALDKVLPRTEQAGPAVGWHQERPTRRC